MTRNHLTLLGLAAAVVVLAADQASKWWILDVVRLRTSARSSCSRS